ncbi:MAG TPA: hypothetical protein PLM05_01920 [Bacteroidales bacterium]|nr:hypothetical protein [Bacteroidales bacterium]
MNPFTNRSITTLFFFFLSLFFTLPGRSVAAQDTTVPDTLSRAFYDSLRVRAEKRRLTRLLYDMIIVTPAPSGHAREELASTTAYEAYEGRKIRNIEIIRLDAFGQNIDNPEGKTPSRAQRFMNSTYTKTRRFVLSQNLVFKTGDTISSLELSDNERLLRRLPFIDDSRITVVPADSNQADIAVIVREKYPVGANLRIDDIRSGKVGIFTSNFVGLGHELEISTPYDFNEYDAPGIGLRYSINNIARTFSRLNMHFSDGLGTTHMGGAFSRNFATSETRWAWSASVTFTRTNDRIDTMAVPAPLRFTWQDYWAARSFMLDRSTVTRLIITGRYMHNNVFRRPGIDAFSYYRMQNYQSVTGSIALSSQRFLNTSLIYSYGRTEDIPYGYMAELLLGREKNEFKWRSYAGGTIAYGNFYTGVGYLYTGAGISAFYNNGHTEQGLFQGSLRYFTPLARVGRSRMRTFINLNFCRGFNRYTDEYLYFRDDGLIRGFRNDSLGGNTRIAVSVEPVLFVYKPVIGFRFALFAFADAGLLSRGRQMGSDYYTVAALGGGVRIRNDQLVLNTLQLRIAWYPNSPPWSESSLLTANSIMRLRPPGFEPDPPGLVPYL